ncbi:hypothetical protein M9H77_25255 [Catharanthus roseus]|uniref:Uncharacterized protein n=1 Tax=Catharanthus roseus TaxID=4058 RepID=A0ACC0A925_CATRO|nr:hypothetical protein M9H77_25255 [Catharanthus roseus]
MDVWKTGIKVQLNSNGIVTRDEIEKHIKQVMEEEKGIEFRSNATKWKKLAIKSMEEGGSSDLNIKHFISKLIAFLVAYKISKRDLLFASSLTTAGCRSPVLQEMVSKKKGKDQGRKTYLKPAASVRSSSSSVGSPAG